MGHIPRIFACMKSKNNAVPMSCVQVALVLADSTVSVHGISVVIVYAYTFALGTILSLRPKLKGLETPSKMLDHFVLLYYVKFVIWCHFCYTVYCYLLAFHNMS